MARMARTPVAVDTDFMVRYTEHGLNHYLNTIPRNDLRALAAAMGLGGAKESTNEEMRGRIITYVETHGAWTNESKPQPDRIPMPRIEPDDEIPDCPKCNSKMRKRDGKHGPFWGCSRYPVCNGTRPIHDVPPKVPSQFPYVLHCPTGDHPSIIVSTEADERWANTCAICGAIMQRHAPTPKESPTYPPTPTEPAIDPTYVKELESEVITLTERAENAELQIKALLPVPIIDGDKPSHMALPKVVSVLQAGLVAYLAGPPGTGKSEIAKGAAEALNLPLIPMPCHPGMMASAFFGYWDASGRYVPSLMRQVVENGGVFLLDEVDNGSATLIAALNSMISNGAIAFPDKVIHKHDDFRLIATANTWGTGPTAEFVGRLGLDRATLDRMTRIPVPIDESLETVLVHGLIHADVAETILKAVRTIRGRIESQGLRILASPRMSLQTATLMHAGWTLADALATTSLATVDDATRARLLEGVI